MSGHQAHTRKYELVQTPSQAAVTMANGHGALLKADRYKDHYKKELKNRKNANEEFKYPPITEKAKKVNAESTLLNAHEREQALAYNDKIDKIHRTYDFNRRMKRLDVLDPEIINPMKRDLSEWRTDELRARPLKKREAELNDKLSTLQPTGIEGFKHGGMVPRTFVYELHKGEMVIPKHLVKKVKEELQSAGLPTLDWDPEEVRIHFF